jgi:hypothetical protein
VQAGKCNHKALESAPEFLAFNTKRVNTRQPMDMIRSVLLKRRQRRADVGFDSGRQGSVEPSETSIHP